METNSRLIKEIEGAKYAITMYESTDGKYYIAFAKVTRSESGEPVNMSFDLSEGIDDYKTASYLFDLKLQELEGN